MTNSIHAIESEAPPALTFLSLARFVLSKNCEFFNSMRTAIFLERDGILNLDRVENGQPSPPMSLEQMERNLEALEPLRQLRAMGFLLIVTTHQPELSRGTLSRRELDRMHTALRQSFGVDDIFVCPHEAADACPCRKPHPGLLTEAAFKWHLNLEHSFVVSNKWQDAEAARQAGCASFLIASPWLGKGRHDMVVPNLAEVVKKITRLHSLPQAMVA
jgi:D-glycero-D-manno-heptose 1,7-bisphosphate phosphatase